VRTRGEDFAVLLGREVQAFQREIAMFPDDESVWKTPEGITNSAGALARHIAGNLQHFVGAVLGGSSYTRNREAEFESKSATRAELVAELDAALAAVRTVLPGLPDDVWAREFPEPVMGHRLPADRFLIHLCAHAAYHLGQTGYLRRVLTRDASSSGALPLKALAE
jgi:uncharacterized damage-inducible protein DinB